MFRCRVWFCRGTCSLWLDFGHDLSDLHFLALSDFGVEDSRIRRSDFLGNLVSFQGEEELIADDTLAVFFMPDG